MMSPLVTKLSLVLALVSAGWAKGNQINITIPAGNSISPEISLARPLLTSRVVLTSFGCPASQTALNVRSEIGWGALRPSGVFAGQSSFDTYSGRQRYITAVRWTSYSPVLANCTIQITSGEISAQSTPGDNE